MRLNQTQTSGQMAALISDEKWLVLLGQNIFGLLQYATGYHQGPVGPPCTVGASFIPQGEKKFQQFS